MAIGDFTKSFIDTLSLDSVGLSPVVVDYIDNIKVCAYVGPNSHGWICTLTCDNDGQNLTKLHSFEFDAVDCDQYHLDLKMISQADGTFAVVHRGAGLASHLTTIAIQANGTITGQIDRWSSWNFIGGWFPKLLHRSGTVWIIISTDNGSGFAVTLNIANNGTITKSFIDWTQFLVAMKCVSIAYVEGDWHALVYLDAVARGYVASLAITAAGAIAANIQHSAQFGTSIEAVGNLIELSTNYFAFTFDAANATLQTCSVSAAGSCALIANTNFGSDADSSWIITLPATTMRAIVWPEVAAHGNIATYDVSVVGVITTPYQDLWASFDDPGDDPFIIFIYGSVYLVIYTGSLAAVTISIESPSLANPRSRIVMT